LNELHLGTNELSGTIPTEVGAIDGLRYLSLDNNELTGTVPFHLMRANLEKDPYEVIDISMFHLMIDF